MKYLLLFLLLHACSSKKETTTAQTAFIDIEKIAVLNSPLIESSGLTTINKHLFTHNDSGSSSTIYKLDTLGKIQQTTTFENLQNTDWEAITHDDAFMYIGDFGNNLGNRADLKVYKIPIDQRNYASASYESISISYEDQKEFAPRNQRHAYDLEAMVAIEDKLYLFSKDWSNLQTTIYKLDKNPGPHTLQSNATLPVRSLITDATFNGTNRLVLTSYDSGLQPYIIILHFDNGTFTLKERIPLPIDSSQIEAITYYETKDGIETYHLTSEAVNISLGDIEASSNGAFYKMQLKASTK
jgi:hypothetical protein